MDKELEALFEINSSAAPKEPTTVKIGRHLGIRLGLLAVAYVLLALWYVADNSSDTGYAILYLGILFIPGIWIGYMLLETIVLHFRAKPTLRNANLLCLLAFVVLALLLVSSIR